MSRAVDLICPTFHVEQLGDDEVWQALQRSLRRLVQHGGRCTAFVATGRAQRHGHELGARLDWLVGEGHEIAMHTHYRPMDATDAEKRKHGAVTDRDVIHSLESDFEYLVARGHAPKGFCAGVWSNRPIATTWLGERGFEYECTNRSNRSPDGARVTIGGCAQDRLVRSRTMIEVPATASLRSMFLASLSRRYPAARSGSGTYALFYLHDYDLRSRRLECAFSAVVSRLQPRVVPVRELVSTSLV